MTHSLKRLKAIQQVLITRYCMRYKCAPTIHILIIWPQWLHFSDLAQLRAADLASTITGSADTYAHTTDYIHAPETPNGTNAA